MGRLSIEISEQQHQQIKTMAVVQGLTIKEYVLQQTIPSLTPNNQMTEQEAIEKLGALLAPRIAAAERKEFSNHSIDEILREARLRFKA